MKNFALILVICIGILSRLIPHSPNFTALGAVALFAGANLRPRSMALLVPFAIMLLTDYVIGFHSTMIFVYLSFAAITLLSSQYLRATWISRISGALGASILFFTVTNLGVWLSGEIYAKNFAGLVQTFLMAIPFFKYQIAADLIFTTSLFAAWDRLQITKLFQTAK